MDPLIKVAKMDDLQVIMDVLQERSRKYDEEINLENARLVLFIGLRNRPEAWTVTMAELPELWAEFEAVKA